MTYTYDGLLSLDARRERLLLDVNDEVSGLEVPGDVEGQVQVADCLRPLVGQGGLLLGLLLARGRDFGGGRICR